MSILIRRWSDGAEYRVADIHAYNRLYKGNGWYIPFGEYATHTPDGLPLPKPTPPSVPRISHHQPQEVANGTLTTQPVSTGPDDQNTTFKPPRPRRRASSRLRNE